MKKNSMLSVYIFMESSMGHLILRHLLCNLCKRVCEAKTFSVYTRSSYHSEKYIFVSFSFVKIKLC